MASFGVFLTASAPKCLQPPEKLSFDC